LESGGLADAAMAIQKAATKGGDWYDGDEERNESLLQDDENIM